MQSMVFNHNEYLYQYSSQASGLVVRKFTLDTHSLKITLEKEYLWKCKAEVKVLAAASVKEIASGSQLPVFLISVSDDRKGPPLNANYLLCVETENITVMRKLTLDFTTFDKPCNCVRIVDGPSVLLHGKNGIKFYNNSYLHIGQDCNFQYSSLDLTNICCAEAHLSCKTVKFVQVHTTHRRHFVFTAVKFKATCPSHISNWVKEVHVCQILNKFCNLRTEQFIPREYIDTVSSMCIVDISCDKDDVFSSTLYIGTSDAFVLHISNGNVMNCISLSRTSLDCSDEKYISSIMHVYTLEVIQDRTDDKLLICQEKELRWTVLDKELRVEETYTDVNEVFAGDFTKCGECQLLLLKDSDLETGQWILTDLCSFHLCNINEQSGQQSEDKLKENTGAVLRALQSKLQTENSCLMDQKLLCQQRLEFLNEMCARCSYESQPINCLNPNQPVCMVPLVTGHDESDQQRSPLHSNEPLIKEQEIWQRTINGHWCIGTDIVSKSGRDMLMAMDVVLDSDTNLRLVKSVCSVTATTDSYKPRLLDSDRQMILDTKPSCKRNVNKCINTGNALCTVSGVTPLPEFRLSSQCSAVLVLHLWAVSQSIPEADNSHEGATREPAMDCLQAGAKQTWLVPCGEVTLTSRDVVQGQHEVRLRQSRPNDGDLQQLKELKRDLVALRQTQTSTLLSIKSSPGILSCLDSLLSDRCGFVYTEVLDCFTSNQAGLDCAQLILGPICSQGCRDLDIITNHEREVFLVLHHLYSCLPDTILIVPRHSGSSLRRQNFCLNMSKEIAFLINGISELLNKHETQAAKCETDSSTEEDCVRKVGEKFKISRGKLEKKQTDALSREQTFELAKVMEEMQKKTDMALANIGNS